MKNPTREQLLLKALHNRLLCLRDDAIRLGLPVTPIRWVKGHAVVQKGGNHG